MSYSRPYKRNSGNRFVNRNDSRQAIRCRRDGGMWRGGQCFRLRSRFPEGVRVPDIGWACTSRGGTFQPRSGPFPACCAGVNGLGIPNCNKICPDACFKFISNTGYGPEADKITAGTLGQRHMSCAGCGMGSLNRILKGGHSGGIF